MHTNGNRIAIVGLFMALACAVSAHAQSEISWYTIDGGGGTSTGGGYSISGTIGQPDAGPAAESLTGGAYELTGGFWVATQVCGCLGDLNHDGQKNGSDVQKFVDCFLFGGDCSCADANQSDGVTVADVQVFVADILAGSSCP